MRKLIILATTLMLFSCGSDESESSGGAENESDAGAPHLLFLGDSLTAGHGLPMENAMPTLIQQRIDAEGMPYKVINAGRSGDTSSGGLARVGWYLRSDLKITAVVIGLGSNDTFRGIEIETIESNLVQIVRKIKQHDPNIRIFLFQMYTLPNLGEDYANEYPRLFERVAEQEGITLLPFPLEGVAGDPELNQEDGIHPTAEGTRMVANNVWSALKPHL